MPQTRDVWRIWVQTSLVQFCLVSHIDDLPVGEITMYGGKDAEKVIRGEENELLLKAGEFGCWERGWKYSAKNTGDIPVTFFWGLGEPPEGVQRRMVGP